MKPNKKQINPRAVIEIDWTRNGSTFGGWLIKRIICTVPWATQGRALVARWAGFIDLGMGTNKRANSSLGFFNTRSRTFWKQITDNSVDFDPANKKRVLNVVFLLNLTDYYDWLILPFASAVFASLRIFLPSHFWNLFKRWLYSIQSFPGFHISDWLATLHPYQC